MWWILANLISEVGVFCIKGYNARKKGVGMACRFCPKIKKYDILWIVVVCVAMWAVNAYQNQKTQKQQQVEIEAFKVLQKKCLFGDKEACEKVYNK